MAVPVIGADHRASIASAAIRRLGYAPLGARRHPPPSPGRDWIIPVLIVFLFDPYHRAPFDGVYGAAPICQHPFCPDDGHCQLIRSAR